MTFSSVGDGKVLHVGSRMIGIQLFVILGSLFWKVCYGEYAGPLIIDVCNVPRCEHMFYAISQSMGTFRKR